MILFGMRNIFIAEAGRMAASELFYHRWLPALMPPLPEAVG